ncbi:MAG: DUF4824 family protein [Gammaproteobacteria bacterium]
MPKLAILSAVLLLLVNVIVLAGVSYNRSGENISHIVFTERELSVLSGYSNTKENSGMTLSINWSVLRRHDEDNAGYYRIGSPDWLDDAKLKELGIDTDTIRNSTSENRSAYERSEYLTSTEVVYVLEYDGAAYQRDLQQLISDVNELGKQQQADPNNKQSEKRLDNKNKRLKRMQLSDSRLYVIDAGLNLQTLMEKYSDKSKYMLMRGELKPVWHKGKLTGRIKRVFISKIHVPLAYATLISKFTGDKAYINYGLDPVAPRYEIELSMGKRLEPWIESVSDIRPATEQ